MKGGEETNMVFLMDQIVALLTTVVGLLFSLLNGLVTATISNTGAVTDVTALSVSGATIVSMLANIVKEGLYFINQLIAALV